MSGLRLINVEDTKFMQSKDIILYITSKITYLNSYTQEIDAMLGMVSYEGNNGLDVQKYADHHNSLIDQYYEYTKELIDFIKNMIHVRTNLDVSTCDKIWDLVTENIDSISMSTIEKLMKIVDIFYITEEKKDEG